MRYLTSYLIAFFGMALFSACTPQDEKAPVDVHAKLKEHVYFLADEKLEGRMTGSKGEELAFKYIQEQFQDFGLDALDKLDKEDTYIQAFDFVYRKSAGGDNRIVLNSTLIDTSQYFPLAQAANKRAEGKGVFVGFGIEASALGYNDYSDKGELEGKIFIIETSSPDGNHPHSKYIEHLDIGTKVEKAIAKGAAGIIFVNRDQRSLSPPKKLSTRTNPTSIPVMFLDNPDLLPDNANNADLLLETEIVKEERTGHNVLAFKNNDAAHTVVIGAHYDHLGHGETGSSLATEEGPAIHPGADDNASGVAVLLELARMLSRDTLTGNNYLFIAFSGEEIGLLGSNYFVKQPLIPLDKVTYMINMDMVGRLDSTGRIIMNGIGSSPIFKPVVDSIAMDNITVRTSESGIGPSDHTSFYLQDIPVIHFFTGSHEDYHKPSDVAEKVNYDGLYTVFQFITTFIADLDDKGKLEFTKTQDLNNENVPRFTVSLGVIPDYLYDGVGMRIEGVREGRPADKAGIKSGDIVTQLGGHSVTDMNSYMRALSYLRKGDQIKVTVQRDGEGLVVTVTL